MLLVIYAGRPLETRKRERPTTHGEKLSHTSLWPDGKKNKGSADLGVKSTLLQILNQLEWQTGY